MTAPVPLVTFGHGLATPDQLASLLHGAGVTAVVDVRTAPGSRRNPDARRERLAEWLPGAGVEYRWEKRLGGFRKAAADSPDVFWEHAQFRGYAGYTRDPEFLAAAEELLRQAARTERTAVMCAESLWWRCHRRIIADFAVLARGTPVLHLAHDGRLTEHPAAPGARLREDGLLVYDRL